MFLLIRMKARSVLTFSVQVWKLWKLWKRREVENTAELSDRRSIEVFHGEMKIHPREFVSNKSYSIDR